MIGDNVVTEASRKGTNMKVRKPSRADQLSMFPSGHCPNPRAKAPTSPVAGPLDNISEQRNEFLLS